MGSALCRRAAVVVAAMCAFAGLAAGGQAAEPFDTRITDYVIQYDEASFWFEAFPAGIAGMRYECRHDGAVDWTACTSPVERTTLDPGTHSIEVRGVAGDGTVDGTPANLMWTATAPPPPPRPPGPENDHWLAATPISGSSGSVLGTTVNATRQWNEPYNPMGAGHSVWYVWTATRDATVTITASSEGFSPVVAAYVHGNSEFNAPVAYGAASTSFKTWTGITYKLGVDGEATGAFTLEWAYEEVGPTNDWFDQAEELVGFEGSTFATTVGATIEWNEVRHDGDPHDAGGNSVWFRWVAPGTGPYVLWTEGSSFDTSLRPYRATAAHGGMPLGFPYGDASPWSGDARVVGNAVEGEVLYISLDGEDASTGTTTLRWRQTVDTGDTLQPQVTLLSPAPNEDVSDTLVLSADAWDDEGVDRVEYWISPYDTSFTDWYIGTAYAPPYDVTLKTYVLEPGRYDVHVRAYDASGNQAGSIEAVWIDATPPPALIVPRDIRAEATSPAGAVVSFTATARDWTGRSLPVTCKPASGSTFRLGATTVTCSATDSKGSTASRSFRIIVTDTTPPDLSLPASLAVDATSPDGVVVEFVATATDLVSGQRPVTCEPASGTAFAIGDTTVSCRAADVRPNWASGSFVVHVRGALEQTELLRGRLGAYSKLQQQLLDVAKHLRDGQLTGACGGLQDVAVRLGKDAGTESLVADATRIRAVAGC